MKFIVAFLLISVYCVLGDDSDSDWKRRMAKYGDLTDCEYYATSETEYRDYFQLDNLQEKKTDEHLYKFRFYYLGKKSFKYRLYTRTDVNVRTYFGDSLPPDYDISVSTAATTQADLAPAYEPNRRIHHPIHRMRRNTDDRETSNDIPSTTVRPAIDPIDPIEREQLAAARENLEIARTTLAAIRAEQRQRAGATENYISSTRATTAYTPASTTTAPSITTTALPSYAERIPQAGNSQTRVQVSANSFFGNQPNEVLVEIFKNGTLRAAINGDIIQQAQILNAFEIKFYSFAATKNREVDEFFHNCAVA